jgi:hypothetical protein
LKKILHKKVARMPVWWWLGGQAREVAQTMYTHVSRCKNDKIKKILKTQTKQQQKRAPA